VKYVIINGFGGTKKQMKNYLIHKFRYFKNPKTCHLWVLRSIYQAGTAVFWISTVSLFVENFGINLLPLLFLLSASLMLLGSIFSHFFFIRISVQKYLIAMLLLTIASLIFSFIFSQEKLLFFAFLLLAKDLFLFQFYIGLSKYKERLIDPAEAPAVMPFVDTSITFGSLFGSLIFLQLLVVFPLKTIVLGWTIPLAIMAWLIYRTMTSLDFEIPNFVKISKRVTRNPMLNTNTIFSSVRYIRQLPFLAFMATFSLFYGFMTSLLDLNFLQYIAQGVHTEASFISLDSWQQNLQASIFSDLWQQTENIGAVVKNGVDTTFKTLFVEENLAKSLGVFNILVGIGALIFQFFLSAKISKKLGIVYGIFLYIIGFMISLLAVFAGGGIKVVKIYKHIFYSLGSVPYHLSIYAIFDKQKESVLHIFEGILKPLGVIIGVGLFFVFPTLFSDFLAPILLASLAILLFVFRGIRKSYTEMAEQNLLSNTDNFSAHLHAIDILSQKGHHAPAELLLSEFKKARNNFFIKLKIIKALQKHINEQKVIMFFFQTIKKKETSVKIKRAILKAFLFSDGIGEYWKENRFGRYHLTEIMKNIINNCQEKQLHKLALINLFRHLPEEEIVPYFLELLEKSDEFLQSICMRESQIFEDPSLVFYLEKFLKSTNMELRGNTLISLWKYLPDDYRDRILKNFLTSKDKRALVTAFYCIGELRLKKYLMTLWQQFNHEDEEIRLHILVALSKQEDLRAIDFIVNFILEEDINEESRTNILEMIKRSSEEFLEQFNIVFRCEIKKKITQLISQENPEKAIERWDKKDLRELLYYYELLQKYDMVIFLQRILKD